MTDMIKPYVNSSDVRDAKKAGVAAMNNLGTSLEDISGQVAEFTHEFSDKAISTVRKYPLHTALAAAGVGFIVGALVARK